MALKFEEWTSARTTRPFNRDDSHQIPILPEKATNFEYKIDQEYTSMRGGNDN